MLVVGITGGSGSGKSYICKALCKLGYTIIDADQIAREIVKPGEEALVQIVAEFGEDVLNTDGTLNRKALADIVFSDKDALALLNRITHTQITTRIRALLCDENAQYIIDAPLLYEAGLDKLCFKVIGVTADADVRIARIIARDTITEAMAHKRLNSQKSIEANLLKVDMLIDTTDNPSSDSIALKIDNFIRREIHEDI